MENCSNVKDKWFFVIIEFIIKLVFGEFLLKEKDIRKIFNFLLWYVRGEGFGWGTCFSEIFFSYYVWGNVYVIIVNLSIF